MQPTLTRKASTTTTQMGIPATEKQRALSRDLSGYSIYGHYCDEDKLEKMFNFNVVLQLLPLCLLCLKMIASSVSGLE
jgi:hypothetical protein